MYANGKRFNIKILKYFEIDSSETAIWDSAFSYLLFQQTLTMFGGQEWVLKNQRTNNYVDGHKNVAKCILLSYQGNYLYCMVCFSLPFSTVKTIAVVMIVMVIYAVICT